MNWSKDIPILKGYDAVVCGGGPAGIAAALAAQRAGLEVLVVEAQAQLGGTGTSGIVSHWLGGRANDCRRWVVGGIFRELAEEAVGEGIALLPVPEPGRKYQPHGWFQGQLGAGIPFDPFLMAAYIEAQDEPRFKKLIKKLEASGEWPFPYNIVVSVQMTGKDVFMVNTCTIEGIAGTDGASVTAGIVKAHAANLALLRVLRKHFPGFSKARVKAVAPMLGVRETRRIVGEYKLTVADVVGNRQFPDTVGLSAYGWDMGGAMHVEKPPYTPIPYRIMVPHPITNLVCPGRAVSVEWEALGPLRLMAPVMAMGQAAGQAAGQAVRSGCGFKDVDVPALQAALRQAGAILDAADLQEQR